MNTTCHKCLYWQSLAYSPKDCLSTKGHSNSAWLVELFAFFYSYCCDYIWEYSVISRRLKHIGTLILTQTLRSYLQSLIIYMISCLILHSWNVRKEIGFKRMRIILFVVNMCILLYFKNMRCPFSALTTKAHPLATNLWCVFLSGKYPICTP